MGNGLLNGGNECSGAHSSVRVAALRHPSAGEAVKQSLRLPQNSVRY